MKFSNWSGIGTSVLAATGAAYGSTHNTTNAIQNNAQQGFSQGNLQTDVFGSKYGTNGTPNSIPVVDPSIKPKAQRPLPGGQSPNPQHDVFGAKKTSPAPRAAIPQQQQQKPQEKPAGKKKKPAGGFNQRAFNITSGITAGLVGTTASAAAALGAAEVRARDKDGRSAAYKKKQNVVGQTPQR